MAKGLTARQKQIWALKLQGLSREAMATELGIDKGTVGNAITTIRKKLGLFGKKEMNANQMEVQNPEVAAAAIDAASDPFSDTQADAIAKVNETLKKAGVPGRVSIALMRRMRVKYGDVVQVKKSNSINEMIQKLDENIALIDEFIDPLVVSSATLKDLAYAKSVFIDRKQLLSGAPTQIISDAERKNMMELIPMLVAEGKRRGIEIDVTPTKVENAKP